MDTSSNSSIEKCTCDNKSEPTHSQESDSSNSESCAPPQKDGKKFPLSLTALSFNLRRGRSKRNKKPPNNVQSSPSTSACNAHLPPANAKEITKKAPKWGIKFNCTKKEPKVTSEASNCCNCTLYRRNEGLFEALPSSSTSPISEKVAIGGGEAMDKREAFEENVIVGERNVGDGLMRSGENEGGIGDDCGARDLNESLPQQVSENGEELGEAGRGIYGISRNSSCICIGPWDMQWLRTMHEDCDEAARLARAREIEQGVEAPADYRPRPYRRIQLLYPEMENEAGTQVQRLVQLVYSPEIPVDSLKALFQQHVTLKSCPFDANPPCHTQIDFIHRLVPDLLEITKCSFYWGKMDRYEAERLLDGKQEGTFLLRDSAQEEFLFSVSFRKYNRSLHARIEQWNHRFSFDSHDPGVYNSRTVCDLIEHYKDPTSCMFFEPMLTWPLHRNAAFSLQHLCRATIVDRLSYDNINQLQLPKVLKSYLKEYHYKQKIRVNRFEDDMWLDVGDYRESGGFM